MNTTISNCYNPNFTGLKIDRRITGKLRQAIKQNPAVQCCAEKLDLNFEFIPLNPKSKNGFVFCVISQMKKSFWDYLNPFKKNFNSFEIHLGVTKQKNRGILSFLRTISEQKDFFEREYLEATTANPPKTIANLIAETTLARNKYIYGFDPKKK